MTTTAGALADQVQVGDVVVAQQFAQHHPRAMAVKADFIRCETAAEWHEVIERHYGPEAEVREVAAGWAPSRVTDASAAMAMADADLECAPADAADGCGTG